MKKCFKCGEILSLSKFYAHKRMPDGRVNKCKNCSKRDAKEKLSLAPQCCVDGCSGRAYGLGMCQMHYARQFRHGSPLTERRGKSVCSIEGCSSFVAGRGLCVAHYKRLKRNGDPLVTKRRLNGDGTRNSHGYIILQEGGVKKREHVWIAEKAIGRPLPLGAVVHHVNEVKMDNRPENLVVCPDRAYHNLIHARTDAYNACGDANWLRCTFCKQYDDPKNLHIPKNRLFRFWHKSCDNKAQQERRAKLKEAA